MAEKGAHLTATTQLRPSIFEVVAQDALSATFHPALKRIAEFLATSNPERYGWLVRWYEEAYFVLNGFLQNYYLKYYGASFAETFYGLQRVSLKGEPLSERGRFVSLLCLVVFPYARSKLEVLATRLKFEEADGVPPSSGWTWGTRRAVIVFHKWFHTVWETAVLLQYLTYLTGKTANHSPLLRIARLTLQYAPEITVEDSLEAAWNSVTNNTSRLSMKTFGRALIGMLEVGAFFLQFLRWWQTEKGDFNLTALPVPPPPEVPVEAERYSGKCPICFEQWRNETVLPVSGYVFCYRCIVKYVQENGCCPITKYPTSVNDLIRVYK
ncbi:peroxisome assembly protein 12 [Anabrus simplex]|uniref:peroxisome assembly protein 12 n=1 Tax=Anabrus simplex TaxID=316456 RepID=UPI0035A29E5C